MDKKFISRHYNLKKISELKEIEINSIIDIIGVVYSTSDLIEFTSQKMKKKYKKRTIKIIDESLVTVECTLWNKNAEIMSEKSLPIGTIIFLPDTKISSFGGVSLSANMLCKDDLLPKIDRINEIKNWLDKMEIIYFESTKNFAWPKLL
jgi:hypothetical protein